MNQWLQFNVVVEPKKALNQPTIFTMRLRAITTLSEFDKYRLCNIETAPRCPHIVIVRTNPFDRVDPQCSLPAPRCLRRLLPRI